MDDPDMKSIEKLIRNSKYIVATSSLFNYKRGKDVCLMGYSNKKLYDACFGRWNDGFTSFYYGVCVKDGVVVDENGIVLNVTFISDCSRKTINERIRIEATE